MSLADLLPRDVVVRGGDVADPAWAATVGDVERAAVAGAVPARVADFVAGRGCARAALRALGVEAGPIGVGDRRQPLWPSGVVGSITHGAGEVAAAVARTSHLAALGIDVEPLAPLPTEVARLVCSDVETARLTSLPVRPDVGAVVLFSAKESLFKAWYPLRGSWIGFEHADVHLRADGTLLGIVTPDAGAPVGWHGRWEVDAHRVRTAVVVPTDA